LSIVADAGGAEPALPAGAFGASNLSVDDRTGRKIVALSHPIRDDRGRQIGLLVMTVDLLMLNDRLLSSTPEHALVTVVDRTRAVIFRSRNLETYIGTRPAAGEPDPSKGIREGFVVSKGRDGVPRLFAFQTLPGIGWRVAASLPEADVFADYRAALMRTMGVGLGLCLLALGLAWRLSAAIARPIAHLQQVASQVAAGNGAIRARLSGPPEIRSVAQQFNQMLDARAFSEARLRGIFDSAVDAILTANQEQVIVQANLAAASMFRCRLDALIGAPLARFVPERFRSMLGRDFLAIDSALAVRPMGLKRDVTALRADGMEFAVEASISRAAMAGWPLYTVILRDITERKQAEQDLRASASKLQAALSSMSDAVCISDVDGRLVEFNDAFAAFHGFADKSECSTVLADYAEILDMVIRDGDHAPLEDWPLSRALRGEVGTNVEYRLRRKDTGAKWIGSYSFAPVRSEDGAIAGAVMTARDVTAIREVQLDLESSHFALQQLIASRDQVQEEERKRIARELHDDLQQTLAAIRMDLHVIAERFGADAPELPALVAGADRLAQGAVVSTRRIVNDLRPPMLEDLGLVTALEAMASQFSQQSGIACEIDADDDVTDKLQEAQSVAICLYRVIQEALNNVGKHSRASEVHVRLVKAPANSISLRVRDNGRGMGSADRRKLNSFGILGMQERVRAHGGVMHIDSSPEDGTVLDVLVPLVDASLAPGPLESNGSADRSEAESSLGSLDDPDALPRLLSRATDKTLQDVIDAISGIVAVMDRRGTIRFVNRAWAEFADCNGKPGTASIGPGANYLEVCRRSAFDDAVALNVLRGLEEVLFEGRSAFSCDYPCHSEDERRWFRMHATPMANGDVLVAHFLISADNAIGVH
jgi:PAS domain S-box-containing protein